MSKFADYTRSVSIQPASGGAAAITAQSAQSIQQLGGKFLSVATTLAAQSQAQQQRLQRGEFLAESQEGIDKANQQAFEQGVKDVQQPVAQMFIKGSVANFASQAFNQPINLKTLTDFDKQVNNFKSGIVQAYPSEMHGFLNNVTDYYSQNAKSAMAQQLDQKTGNQLQGTFLSFVNSNQQDIENANAMGNTDAAEAFTGQLLQKSKQALENNLITPVEFANIHKRATNSAVESYYLGQLQQSMQQGTTEKFFANFNKANTGLTPDEQFRLETKMQSMMALQRRQAALNGINLTSQMKDAVDVMQQYGNPGMVEPTRSLVSKYAPELLPEFNKKLSLAQTAHTVINAVQDLDPSSINVAMQSINQKIDAAKESNDLESLQFFNKLKMTVGKAYNNLQVRASKDPFAFFQQSAAYDDAVNTTRTAAQDNMGNKVTTANGLSASTIDNAAINYFKQKGFPESTWSLLSKPQANQIMNQLKSLPPGQQVEQIQALLNQHDYRMWPYILKPLRDAGLKTSSYAMVGMLQNPQTRGFIPDVATAQTIPFDKLGYESNDVKLSNIKAAVDSEMSNFYHSADGYNNLGSNTLSAMRDTVVKYAAFLASPAYNPSENLSESDAAKEAYNRILGYRYQFVSLPNSTMRVPNNVVNEQQINLTHDEMLQYMDDNKLVIPASYKERLQGLTPAQQQVAYKAYIKSQGTFVTTGDDLGVEYLVNKNLIKTVSGVPMKLSFDEIRDPTSSANDILNEKEKVERLQRFQQRFDSIISYKDLL